MTIPEALTNLSVFAPEFSISIREIYWFYAASTSTPSYTAPSFFQGSLLDPNDHCEIFDNPNLEDLVSQMTEYILRVRLTPPPISL